MATPYSVVTGKYPLSVLSPAMQRRNVVHMCQCVSTRPGRTMVLRPSIDIAPGARTALPTLTIAPLRTWTSPPSISPRAASIVRTYALRITNSPRDGRPRGGAPPLRCCASASGVMAPVTEAVPTPASRRMNARRPRIPCMPPPCGAQCYSEQPSNRVLSADVPHVLRTGNAYLTRPHHPRRRQAGHRRTAVGADRGDRGELGGEPHGAAGRQVCRAPAPECRRG